jgi:aerobic-type carbon monoxide dehydrogenase small subunit (CoxS/CutS family)
MNAPVTVRLTVNGQARTVTTDPQRPLLDVLREDLGLTGTKYGCGEGHCGACTVLINGKRAFACLTPAADLDNKTILTIEGLAVGEKLHPVQEAFLAENGFQCGFCTPGLILATVALLNERPEPTDAQLLKWLDGHLCRCCGYPRILNAVRRAAAKPNTEGKI